MDTSGTVERKGRTQLRPSDRRFAACPLCGSDRSASAGISTCDNVALSHATDVLGRVLEVISGKDLYGAILDTVLGPLEMTDTAFRLQDQQRVRVVQPLPQSEVSAPFFDPCLPRRRQRAGGGLVSTAIDYTRFLRMLLGRGSLDDRRVIDPRTLKQMTVNQLGPDIRRPEYYPPGAGYMDLD
jgi:CubicO group peptidase (beta-lactamase class C family)